MYRMKVQIEHATAKPSAMSLCTQWWDAASLQIASDLLERHGFHIPGPSSESHPTLALLESVKCFKKNATNILRMFVLCRP